jgi:toxin ParE1/3/4
VASIVWSDLASDQMDWIERYVARSSGVRAGQVIARIIRAVDRLEMFPASGRVVPELGDHDIREVIVDSYRVLYRYAMSSFWRSGTLHGD